jgi:hypothetical protein
VLFATTTAMRRGETGHSVTAGHLLDLSRFVLPTSAIPATPVPRHFYTFALSEAHHTKFNVLKYSDSSVNEDNSFRNHIR